MNADGNEIVPGPYFREWTQPRVSSKANTAERSPNHKIVRVERSVKQVISERRENENLHDAKNRKVEGVGFHIGITMSVFTCTLLSTTSGLAAIRPSNLTNSPIRSEGLRRLREMRPREEIEYLATLYLANGPQCRPFMSGWRNGTARNGGRITAEL